MINFNFNNDCCGCRACSEICPKKCISIEKNKKGFFIPVVDKQNCIDCGLCERVCPVLNVNKKEYPDRKLYCAYNKDAEKRKEGSSGSIFYVLAEFVISKGGYVCGAAFDEDLQLRHKMINTLEEVIPLMKSKYIQSNTDGIFVKVKKQLINNQYVLFVGTPCQVQALYNFLGKKEYEKLILVDFICHGVPSQELFDRCIRQYEEDNNCKVVDFCFREKTATQLHNCKIVYDNRQGKRCEEVKRYIDFPFYSGYLKYIDFRDCCYSCAFVGKDRISDFTLGDFWELEFSGLVKDFYKGYSMLYVNSIKGSLVLQRLGSFINIKETALDSPLTKNFAYLKPTKRSILNKFFMWDYNRISHKSLEKRYFSNFREFPLYKKIIWKIILTLNI